MEDLSYGRVPDDIDVLIVISGYGLTEVQEFAIDQFLMRGGSLIVISGKYILSPWQYAGGLTVDSVNSRIHEIIGSYGITVLDAFLMDTQNEPVPMEVSKEVGGSRVLEFELFDYPFWVDVREDGMNDDSLITASLPSVTIQWASPLEIHPDLFSDKEVSILLESSDESWLRRSDDINPDTATYPDMGFPIQGEQKSWPIAISARGSFKSFFADKTSPLGQPESEETGSKNISPFPGQTPVTIEESPDSAKLVVIGSSEFLDDFVLDMSNSITADRYLLSLHLIESTVDWAVEDDTLLSIRSRGTVSRFLKPLEDRDKTFWEILNYSAALGALLVITLIWTLKRRVESPMRLVDTA
jgi:ABC-2 type transport system permease protein